MILQNKHVLYFSMITNGNASQRDVVNAMRTAYTTFLEEVKTKAVKNLPSTPHQWETTNVILRDMVIGPVIAEEGFCLLKLSATYKVEITFSRKKTTSFLKSIVKKLLGLV